MPQPLAEWIRDPNCCNTRNPAHLCKRCRAYYESGAWRTTANQKPEKDFAPFGSSPRDYLDEDGEVMPVEPTQAGLPDFGLPEDYLED